MRLFRTRLFMLVFTLSAILGLTACGGGDDNTKYQPPADATVGAKAGNIAPDFDLKNLEGGNLKLSSLRGKIVIIDFWDTWCPPCRRALPALQALADEYADDLVVVGVAFGRDGEAKVRSYVKENNLTFPMVLTDPQFQVVQDFGNFQGIPTTFLVDRRGIIVKQWSGGHTRAEYEAAVKEVLGQ